MNATRLSKHDTLELEHAATAFAKVLLSPALSDERLFCVCRFVNGLNHGWPLRELSRPSHLGSERCEALGWNGQDPVAFFTEDEAKEVATRCSYPISFDRAVHISAIRWIVRIYSHYDGSDVVHETNDYREALLAFTMAESVCQRENTEHVKYLVASLDGETPVVARELTQGTSLLLDGERRLPG